MTENFENVQRWTAKRRTALILSILKGETSAKEATRPGACTAEAACIIYPPTRSLPVTHLPR